MNVRRLVSIAWVIVASVLLVVVATKFVDDALLDPSCRESSGCMISFGIYFGIVAIEYWCAYAVRGVRPWTGYTLMIVSGLLAFWWLVDFVGNDDRSVVHVYLVLVPQFALAALTILMAATQCR